MNWIRNLKISPRLLAGFGAVLTLMAHIGAIRIIEIEIMNFNANELGTNWHPSVRALVIITAGYVQDQWAAQQFSRWNAYF